MRKVIVGFFVFSSLVLAQGAGTPNCQYTYTLTNRSGVPTDGVSNILVSGGAARTPSINNLNQQCNSWYMTVAVDGFSAISLELDDAQNGYNTVGGFPLAWAAFQGTVNTGSNPTTSTGSSSLNVTGFYPWLSIDLASSTGTGNVYITLYGWKSPALIGSTSGGGSVGPTGPQGPTGATGAGTVQSYTLCASGCSSTIGASPLTVSASTHGQGTVPDVQCFTGSSPYTQVACADTLATNGDLVFTFTSLGKIQIQSAGNSGASGSTGATGPTGPTGSFCYSAQQILATTAASITFSGIPGTCTNLTLKAVARGDSAGVNDVQLSATFNGDTGNNYNSQYILGTGNGTPPTAPIGLGGSMFVSNLPTPGGSQPTTLGPLDMIMSLGSYAQTTFWKTVNVISFMEFDTAPAFQTLQVGGYWASTAAITSITLTPGSGNFIAGSVFTLKGE